MIFLHTPPYATGIGKFLSWLVNIFHKNTAKFHDGATEIAGDMDISPLQGVLDSVILTLWPAHYHDWATLLAPVS